MMNMKEMLGEAGRTISNRDMELAQQMMGMSDNEPMMQDRSPENQMFSIDAQIENLMKSYNMLVNAQEFGRAQEVADQIDQLQQQKIGIQGNLADMAMSFDSQIGSPEFTKGLIVGTISNQDREIISSLLESISE
jgi:replicative DNA helicase